MFLQGSIQLDPGPAVAQPFGPPLVEHIRQLLGMLHSGDLLARKVG